MDSKLGINAAQTQPPLSKALQDFTQEVCRIEEITKTLADRLAPLSTFNEDDKLTPVLGNKIEEKHSDVVIAINNNVNRLYLLSERLRLITMALEL